MTFEDFCTAEHSPDVHRILQQIAANPVDPAIYREALRDRKELQERYRRAFAESRIHALVYPTVVMTAPMLGQDDVLRPNGKTEPLLHTIVTNTTPSTIAGTPSISLPAGYNTQGLPIGMSLEGLPGDDLQILNLATGVEALLNNG
jgi:mandelamide amidase